MGSHSPAPVSKGHSLKTSLAQRTLEKAFSKGENLGTTTALRNPASTPKPLGAILLECPYPVLAFALKEILKEEAHVYEGRKPWGMEDPSLIILFASGSDVASEVRRLRRLAPDAAVLVFGLRIDARLAESALLAGAHGCIHAGMQPEQIVRALWLASKGEILVPKELLENLMEESSVVKLAALTPRQREILDLASEGLSNAQIGERLFLTESTIKQHLYKTYKLLGVRNRTEAAKLLRDAELLDQALLEEDQALPEKRETNGVDAYGLAMDRALDSGVALDGLQRRASRGLLEAIRQ